MSDSRDRRPPPDARAFANDDLFAFLSASLETDPRGGRFRLAGQRLLILRPELLVDLQRYLEQTVGLSSKGFLYLAGETSAREGRASFERLTPSSGSAPEEEAALLARAMGPMALLGWGQLEIVATAPGAHGFLVLLENSPIAEAYGESKRPVCHLIGGWIAGTAELVLGRDFLADEVSCRSMGPPRCEFALRPMPTP